MRRREFIAGLGAAAWPVVARAQKSIGESKHRPIIAWLGGASQADAAQNLNLRAFIEGLRDLGYVDGRNIEVAYRWAESDLSRQPVLIQELIALRPAVIVTANNPAAVAAKQATPTIPIVAPALIDPIGLGLAATFNRPGSNLTGILQTLDGLAAKQMEVFKELVPSATTVALLINAANRAHQTMLRDAETANRNLAVKVRSAKINRPNDIESVLETLKRDGVDGLVILPDGMFFAQAARIIALASALRLATLHWSSVQVRQGGLMSYGVDIAQNYRRAAYFVDRILKGESTSDLPIEFPTKLELVINLKTAKALGLTVPPTLLARADEVIE